MPTIKCCFLCGIKQSGVFLLLFVMFICRELALAEMGIALHVHDGQTVGVKQPSKVR